MSQPYGLDFLVGFATYLRGRGFTISPDQTIGFVEGVSLLGARDPEAVKRVALAMFSVPHERFEAFDLLFRAYFLGEALQFEQAGEDRDDSLEVREDAGLQPVEIEEKGEAVSGLEATEIEILSHRVLDAGGENEALNRFRRLAPRMLPARKTGRYVRSRRGPGIDMRRAVREASRLDGDLARIPMRRRKIRQRRIVLLIDVSGSMKEQSESSLRFAHALSRASERFEAFSLGTRLTRITSALDHRDRELALRHASRLIADLDGGTRIGESLQTLLLLPWFVNFVRGAVVAVISDGLERGSPEAMVDAIRRISRAAWRLLWLTPLLSTEGYSPSTFALSRSLPHIDRFEDGSSAEAMAQAMLGIARAS